MGKSEGNSETWLMTYSDMVTLLLVFFVLLYTMTPGVEDATFNSFLSYFQKSSGILEQSTMSSKSSNAQADADEQGEIEETAERWAAFADFLKKHDLTSEVDIRHMPDGVKITLSDSLTFESGSAELLPLARVVLAEVALLLDQRVNEIEVQGHTDNVPIASTSAYKTNWHLGAARAVSVVQFIQGRANLDPERFKASSYGEYKPVAENNSDDGRRKNRRVEIYIRDKFLSRLAEEGIPITRIKAQTNQE